MSLSTQSSILQLTHVSSTDNLDCQPPTFIHATGQDISGPSHRDPHPNAAFDRWTSLVEVCASTTPTSLIALGSPSFQNSPPPLSHLADNLSVRFLPTLSSMVQAPLSDIEDESRETTLANENDHCATPRNRKKHACELCNKAFDRPSTLKTHLLVHTGITPFSCHICGRRFGVQSNCNRHVRRCAIREELFIARRFEFQALQSKQHHPMPQVHFTVQRNMSNSRSPSPPPSVSKPKRPRRKRSPSAAWLPHSLASFTISSTFSPAPLPLPPVRPKIAHEERDSYKVYHDQPYTQEGWSGRLPGPAPLFEHGCPAALKRGYTFQG